MKKNTIIALTGGIGSGKSATLKMLKEEGFNVISCDEITPEVYQMKTVQKKLIERFNTCSFSEIKKIAFEKDNIEILTDIITPEIFKIAYKRAKKILGTVIMEVPLLFETNTQKYFDKVIVLTRNKTDRIQSVMTRSNLKKEEVEKRISKQFDYENNDLKDFIVIENSGTKQDLKEKILKVIKENV